MYIYEVGQQSIVLVVSNASKTYDQVSTTTIIRKTTMLSPLLASQIIKSQSIQYSHHAMRRSSCCIEYIQHSGICHVWPPLLRSYACRMDQYFYVLSYSRLNSIYLLIHSRLIPPVHLSCGYYRTQHDAEERIMCSLRILYLVRFNSLDDLLIED